MATRNTLHVEVVTAERALYSGEAEIVDAPGSEGQLGILPRHAPLLALLGAGPLIVKLGGGEETIFVSGGFLEVSNDQVTVLADTAEHAEDIDTARAEEARRLAQERLSETRSNTERAELQSILQRELHRLRVAELVRRSGRRPIHQQPPTQD
ncbi:MAG TPA: F0F1 ATP synthase subunit epsilon [Dictyobacter sp.]|jgi:F-type H+-transporting ATPase subunit epsilon|nr:F0F1 ATP synthase subunit epsilon [Dictyobacter sp.]